MDCAQKECGLAGARPVDSARNILIVEDHALSRELLAGLMHGLGWKPLLAGSIAEGLIHLDSAPELIVLDLTLPDGSGTEILRAVRERGLTCQVMIMTGWDPSDSRLDEVRRLQADGLFQKPLDIHAFLERCQGTPAQRLS